LKNESEKEVVPAQVVEFEIATYVRYSARQALSAWYPLLRKAKLETWLALPRSLRVQRAYLGLEVSRFKVVPPNLRL